MCPEGFSAVTVRPCHPKDVSAVLDILAQAPEAAKWSPTALQEALEEPSTHSLVATKADQVLGFAIGRKLHDEGEILNLAVRPESRHQGIAIAVIQSLLDAFERSGVNKVFLEVRESNIPAIAFYQRLGFVLTGRRPAYYRDPPEAALMFTAQLRPTSVPLRTNT